MPLMCFNIFLFCLVVHRTLPVNNLTNQFANKLIKLLCEDPQCNLVKAILFSDSSEQNARI